MVFGIKSKKSQSSKLYNVHSDYLFWQKEHPNFMTPYVVKSEVRGNFILELSEGTDFDHKPFYGVSVIERKENGKFQTVQDNETLKGQAFSNKQDAENYYNQIKEKIK